jgi:hypothetical protein
MATTVLLHNIHNKAKKQMSISVLCNECAEAQKPVEHCACNTTQYKMAALSA